MDKGLKGLLIGMAIGATGMIALKEVNERFNEAEKEICELERDLARVHNELHAVKWRVEIIERKETYNSGTDNNEEA